MVIDEARRRAVADRATASPAAEWRRRRARRSPTSRAARRSVPRTSPASASVRLSMSICRTSRAAPAPSAERSANSRPRSEPRTSSRLAMLTHTSTSTSATAPSMISSARLDRADDVFLERIEVRALVLGRPDTALASVRVPSTSSSACALAIGVVRAQPRDRRSGNDCSRCSGSLPGLRSIGTHASTAPAIGSAEPVRHHADDRVRRAAHRQRPRRSPRSPWSCSSQSRGSGRRPAPLPVFVVALKAAAELGCDAHDIEVFGADGEQCECAARRRPTRRPLRSRCT